MARKLGKESADKADKQSTKERVKETVSEVVRTNCTAETKKEFLVEAREAKKELDEQAVLARAAAQQRNKAHTAYRHVLKRASQSGVNSTALAEALTMIEQDPVEVGRHVRAVNEFLQLAEFPLDPGGQYGLFADGETVAAKVDKAKLVTEDDIEHAGEAGYIAGKAGKPVEDNPYKDEGSPEALKWLGRHRDGQNENLATLGRGPVEGQAAH